MATYPFYTDDMQFYMEKDSKSIDGWLHLVARFMIPIISKAQSSIQDGYRGDIVEIGLWHGLSLLMFDKLSIIPGQIF